jgi:hypothetical protein
MDGGLVDVGRDDAGTWHGECQSRRSTHATSGSGDERNFAGEVVDSVMRPSFH